MRRAARNAGLALTLSLLAGTLAGCDELNALFGVKSDDQKQAEAQREAQQAEIAEARAEAERLRADNDALNAQLVLARQNESEQAARLDDIEQRLGALTDLVESDADLRREMASELASTRAQLIEARNVIDVLMEREARHTDGIERLDSVTAMLNEKIDDRAAGLRAFQDQLDEEMSAGLTTAQQDIFGLSRRLDESVLIARDANALTNTRLDSMSIKVDKVLEGEASRDERAASLERRLMAAETASLQGLDAANARIDASMTASERADASANAARSSAQNAEQQSKFVASRMDALESQVSQRDAQRDAQLKAILAQISRLWNTLDGAGDAREPSVPGPGESTRRSDPTDVPRISQARDASGLDHTRVPDALIASVDPAGDRAYVALGTRDMVTARMRFAMHETEEALASGSAPDAILEVVGVEAGLCALRGVGASSSVILKEGQVISNAAFAPGKRMRVIVFGDFDENRDGRMSAMEAGAISDRVRRWGGSVVTFPEHMEAARRGGRLSIEGVDLVVLGRRPPRPPRPGGAVPQAIADASAEMADRVRLYDAYKLLAAESKIPVIAQNDLDTFFPEY